MTNKHFRLLYVGVVFCSIVPFGYAVFSFCFGNSGWNGLLLALYRHVPEAAIIPFAISISVFTTYLDRDYLQYVVAERTSIFTGCCIYCLLTIIASVLLYALAGGYSHELTNMASVERDMGLQMRMQLSYFATGFSIVVGFVFMGYRDYSVQGFNSYLYQRHVNAFCYGLRLHPANTRNRQLN